MKTDRRFAALIRRTALPVLAAGLFLTMLAGCQNSTVDPTETVPATQPQTVTLPPETQPTEPVPTAPADGNPDDATCQGSYSVSNKEFLQNNAAVVATMDEDVLTNAQLQIYYRMAINNYRAESHEVNPDYDQPLDVQLCPIDDSVITWQQYFLQKALNSWHSYVAMERVSHSTVLATEDTYNPDEKRHTEYLNDQMPALEYLYGYNTQYKISEPHQKYLDELPERLEKLAADQGYESVHDLLVKLTGLGVDDGYLLEYAELMNKGYMLLTALSYKVEPSAQEVEDYFVQHEAMYNEMGITRDSGNVVDFRQILVVPENADIAEDGTVTGEENVWKNALKDAQNLQASWRKTRTEFAFSEIAYKRSDDAGSKSKGGLYSAIAKGQLTDVLDAWCFDPSRKPGDTDILRTDCGYHVVYFSKSTPIWYQQAEKDLIAEQLAQCVEFTVVTCPMEVDYSTICLNEGASVDMTVSTYDVLYHDVAHERFSQAPLYLQQDYPGVMYGRFPLDRYGCGIATMAMLATYFTDEEWTPPELGTEYGTYCGPSGTAHALFTEVPADKNFFCKERVYTWGQAQRALEEGHIVVTLQDEGFWTKAGHYVLLHNLTEDGKLVVRDSNIGNYFTLKGHTLGYFETSTVPGAARCYWVYEKKVIRVPACARCGEGEENLPLAMFNEDYFCPKCQEAMHRRQTYVSTCAEIN